MATDYKINSDTRYDSGLKATDFGRVDREQAFAKSYKGLGYNVFDIYSLVFGYRAFPYPLGILNQIKGVKTAGYKGTNFESQIPATGSEYTKKGTALYGNRNKQGISEFCPVKLIYNGKEVNLPYSTVDLGLDKNIVSTPLTGQRGSVKELININDYKIKIKGIWIDDNNELPEDGLELLNEIWLKNEAVQIKNAFLDFFLDESDKIVITSLSMPDMQGVSYAQAYEFNCVTDSILTLEIAT